MLTNLFSNSFELFGLTINYYGLISALGYLMGVVIVCLIAKKRGFKTDDIITLACYVIPLAIIGARIYYILFSLDEFTNFWDVFKIWNGGLGFYGGLIGGAFGVVLYCLIHKKNFLKLADIVVIGLVLGQGIGRWGNFVNQEAFGFYVDNPNLQWFPFAVYIEHCHQAGCTCGGSGWHLATFFYEFVNNMIICAILLTLLYKVNFKSNGIIAACYLIMYGFCRAVVEGLRMDSLYLGPFRVSQLLSVIFILCGITYIVITTILNKKKKSSYDIIMDVLKHDLDKWYNLEFEY